MWRVALGEKRGGKKTAVASCTRMDGALGLGWVSALTRWTASASRAHRGTHRGRIADGLHQRRASNRARGEGIDPRLVLGDRGGFCFAFLVVPHSSPFSTSDSSAASLELCSFSGFKIHPGHGKRYVRVDDKVLIFINGKSAASMLMKRNPRTTAWTAVYRKANRKVRVTHIILLFGRASRDCRFAVQFACCSFYDFSPFSCSFRSRPFMRSIRDPFP